MNKTYFQSCSLSILKNVERLRTIDKSEYTQWFFRSGLSAFSPL